MTLSPPSSGETRRRIHSRPLIRLGLDASPLRVGYAISLDNTIHAWGTQHIPKDAPIRHRKEWWRELRNQIRSLETHHNADLHTIGIEAPYIGPNKMGSLNHARNIGQHEAHAHASFPYAQQHLIMPTTWRKALGLPLRGKGAPYAYAEDELRSAQIERSYAEGTADTLDQDAADAICIVKALAIIEENDS